MAPRLHHAMRALSARTPAWLKAALRERVSAPDYLRFRSAERNPFAGERAFDVPGSPALLGVFEDYMSYHKDYLIACRELGVSYRVLDLSASDWIEQVRASGCDAFLAWPSPIPLAWKGMFDDRLRLLEEDLGLPLFPSAKEAWLYESKRRQRDWLESHDLPHARSWIFYDEAEARAFVKASPLPIVFKTDSGASATGVTIVRERTQGLRLVREAFGRGVALKRYDPRDRQRGSAYFQEYLPDVVEWRMVRIGRSYFGYRKERKGDFHSASKDWSWLDPPRPLLELLHRVTEAGGFESMDVDLCLTQAGRTVVNELETVFGARTPVDQMRIKGVPGRYLREGEGQWRFEPGDFSRNACANLRVEHLLARLDAIRGGR